MAMDFLASLGCSLPLRGIIVPLAMPVQPSSEKLQSPWSLEVYPQVSSTSLPDLCLRRHWQPRRVGVPGGSNRFPAKERFQCASCKEPRCNQLEQQVEAAEAVLLGCEEARHTLEAQLAWKCCEVDQEWEWSLHDCELLHESTQMVEQECNFEQLIARVKKETVQQVTADPLKAKSKC